MECEYTSPDNDTSPQELRNWHPLDQPVNGVLNTQDRNVNASCEPGVLRTFEGEVFLDTHDRSEGQCSFVEGLEEVGCYHDSEDALVDETFEAGVFGWRDGYAGGVGVSGYFGLRGGRSMSVVL